MEEEKYSRQIKLFGHEAQKRIKESHIHIKGNAKETMVDCMVRLLLQIGANVCRDSMCTAEPTWVFMCDLDKEYIENENTYCNNKNILYISTKTLSMSRAYTEPKKSEVSCIEHIEIYLNILGGMAVQEYVKSVAGVKSVEQWSLDPSIFEN
ncbi:hypothetical protein NEPAR04_1076 [Nematocida parisii]|nr:hypothetical protein NEPAR03_1084 [Nematocida parisii]KAI5141586.1 hypothetical protein NEPAR04_1076 [Nematocida parisii]KAI5144053.1 hypothetical protein NEPAR07_1030 [Nematocida parisii]